LRETFRGWKRPAIVNILIEARLPGGIVGEDLQIKREIVLEADAETLERMRKEGHARGFTVFCDEGERIGGDNTAPPPLAYFGLSVGF